MHNCVIQLIRYRLFAARLTGITDRGTARTDCVHVDRSLWTLLKIVKFYFGNLIRGSALSIASCIANKINLKIDRLRISAVTIDEPVRRKVKYYLYSAFVIKLLMQF
ncbi:hypothetical protein CH256_23355 [Rhodococcus sp. 05-2254-6]|nr:hypothetical protein CH256_23355 [Rhodococcus sp. 05-2254-6]